ncbi:MAG: carboxypeptidase regulatory-like domain-containing protein [Nitrospinota bacterium]
MMHALASFVALAFSLLVSWPAGAYEVAPVSGGGTVAGRIIFKGDAPPPVKLLITKDEDHCGKGQVERREVDVKEGALRGVVVYLDKVKKGKPFPKEAMSPVVDQRKCAYVPFLQVAAKGANVTILNSDSVHHNIHTYELIGSARRSMWNISQPKFRKKVTRKLRVRRGNAMRIECDVHNWMLGWMFVARNPYYAIVGEDGTFQIGDVPAGNYTLRAWHPVLGTKRKKITVPAKVKVAATFTFTAK